MRESLLDAVGDFVVMIVFPKQCRRLFRMGRRADLDAPKMSGLND